MTLLLLGSVAGAQSGLTVWSDAPSFVAQRRFQERADTYALATGTTVTVRTFDFDDLRGRLMGAAADGPDLVVTVPNDWLPGLIEEGVAASLDGLVDDATLREVAPIALGAFSSGGALFGLPVAWRSAMTAHRSSRCRRTGKRS
jgi:arabinogalactan oligomer / maltooligosaccharide transport system substrate-binding protein